MKSTPCPTHPTPAASPVKQGFFSKKLFSGIIVLFAYGSRFEINIKVL